MSARLPHYTIVVVPEAIVRASSAQGKEWFVKTTRGLRFERVASRSLRITGVNLTAQVGEVVLLFVAMKAGRIDDAMREGWQTEGSAPREIADMFGSDVTAFDFRVVRQPFTFPAEMLVHEDGSP